MVWLSGSGSPASAQGGAPPARSAGSAVVIAKDSAHRQPARRFDHNRHQALSCTRCHGSGTEHRTLLVRSPRDCAACHHNEERALACNQCHESGPPARLTLAVAVRISVWDSARVRTLPFEHKRHASLSCLDCHRTPVTLALERDCASCHRSHHTAQAQCTGCHQPPPAPVHDRKVHLSCAGSGCHAESAAPATTLGRNLCLACHAQQRTHEPNGDCASCHRIPHAAAQGNRTGASQPAGRQ